MIKTLSLLFAVIGVLLFMGIGIALSYREPLWALLLLFAAILQIGFGFMLKARQRKQNQNTR